MASGWSAVRNQIRTLLEGSTFGLRRVKRGLSEIGGSALSGAGRALFQDGYLLIPRTLDKGQLLERVSTHRRLAVDLYTGVLIGDDWDDSSDVLVERCEILIRELRNCNKNVPAAKQIDLDGPVRYLEMPDQPSQWAAILPLMVEYHSAE